MIDFEQLKLNILKHAQKFFDNEDFDNYETTTR